MTIQEILNKEAEFRYMLLSRMKMDCDYYIQQSGHPKFLWAKNEYKQIEFMRAIWASFPEDGKPEWLTLEQLDRYEAKLTPWMGDTSREEIATIQTEYAGELFFYYDNKRMTPDRIYFGCQLYGKTMGGDAFALYDNALRPVYVDYGNHSERLYRKGFRNVVCDCKDGYLYNFRRE